HLLAPPAPGLVGDVVAPGDQLRAERQHGEGVAGLAEGAGEDPQRFAPAQPASSATARSCSMRSSRVNAIGMTISVPTPASRKAAIRSRTTSRGPHSETMSMSSSGSAAAAYSFLPSM